MFTRDFPVELSVMASGASLRPDSPQKHSPGVHAGRTELRRYHRTVLMLGVTDRFRTRSSDALQ